MPYTQVINGVTVTSNVPFDQPIAGGSLVTLDLHFNTPVSYLATLGYQLLTIFNYPTFQAQLIAAGWNGTITNYSVYSVDSFTQRIAFIVPVPLSATGIAQPFIAPLIFLYIGVAVAAIIVASAIAVFIVSVGGLVVAAVAGAAPYVLAVVGLVAAIGVGAFVYDFLKEREFRKEAYREAGRAAKGAAKGAVRGGARLAGRAVEAAGKEALRLVKVEDDTGRAGYAWEPKKEVREAGAGIF